MNPFLLNSVIFALVASLGLLSSVFANPATPENLRLCLGAINYHDRLKFKDLSDAELGKLENLTYGISNTQLALFILTKGEAITKNCPKNVTDYFTGKLDSAMIYLIKRTAMQVHCNEPTPACNAHGKKFEAIAKELTGGTAGLARANAADNRYTSSSPAGFDQGAYGVCCKSVSGTHNTNDTNAGGVCGEVESIEKIFPCVPNTSDPIAENDPDFGAFLKKHKPQKFEKWFEKNKNRLKERPRSMSTSEAAGSQRLQVPRVDQPASGIGR